MSNESGKLYVVATPIGNLQDMSPRAVETLSSVDLILAEDTRHSQTLLQACAIRTPLKSCHDHNEQRIADEIIEKLKAGLDIALISDAGTPLISDPGFRLVSLAHEQGLHVVPIPGPSACITALSAAGLPTDEFLFCGFIPSKQKARLDFFQRYLQQSATMIFYEVPHRIQASLEDAVQCFGGDREAAIFREISKRYEENCRTDLQTCLNWLRQKPERSKGEFVLLIGGSPAEQIENQDVIRILKILLSELPKNRAADLCAKITGKKKNECYQLALELDK